MAEPLGLNVPVAPASGLDHHLPSGIPVAPVGPDGGGSHGGAEDTGPPTEFHIGTKVEAIVRAVTVPASAGALAIGTHLMLRIVALPAAPPPDLLIGRVVSSGGVETLIETPLGLLALQRRMALTPDTMIAFERLEELPSMLAPDETPSHVGGWPALDEAIATLAQASPQLATQLRTELIPNSGPELVGTLLFLLSALYDRAAWPGSSINAALAAAGHAKLAQRLDDDAEELRRLEADPATGDWRVLTLPLIVGTIVIPLRLFLRRHSPGAPGEDATRFAVEVELPGFGPLQLDGMLRGTNLILILRSHRGLPEALRLSIEGIYRRALGDWGLSGDLRFATAAEFALAPLSNLRKHVEVRI